ncbi:MAG TPA: hypothetical protein VH988_36320 [Thermoanaerobaculia bacterium]|jgi:hypothetical protein|nr:hypothetical protein [Thermoanaerobaculia bacterium]
MRQLCVVAVFTAALLPATVGADEGVVLKEIPLPVGTKYMVVHGSVTAMDVDSTAAGKSFRVHSEKREAMTYQAEVLAANDVAETKLRVHFLLAEETSQKSGKDASERKVDPVAGKTYLVTAAAGLPTVTAANGRAVSDEEKKKIQSTFSDIGHRDPVCAALVGRTLKPGKVISLDPSVVREMMRMDEKEKVDVESLTVSLREVRKRKSMRVAVFDVGIRIHGDMEGQESMKMTMQAGGTVEYGLDNCWAVQEETQGPITLSGSVVANGQTITMQGSGSVLSTLRMDYP